MIKYLNYRPFVNDHNGQPYVECTGLSTDTKPNASENSLFLELDTKTLYYCSKKSEKGEATSLTFEGTYIARYNSFIGHYGSYMQGEELTIEFDGVQYTLEPQVKHDEDYDYTIYNYGAPYDHEAGTTDFSVYPFQVQSSSDNDEVSLYVRDSGEHTIQVSDSNQIIISETLVNAHVDYSFETESVINVADSLEVVYDGNKYILEKHGYYGDTYYGEPIIDDDAYSYYDFSKYPLSVWLYSDESIIDVSTFGEHTISITPITNAQWTKYGEAPEESNLVDGITVNSSNLVWDDNSEKYVCEVPYYELTVNSSYTLYVTREGETFTNTATVGESTEGIILGFDRLTIRNVDGKTYVECFDTTEMTLRLEETV